MKHITINRARALGKELAAKGVVILTFGDDSEFAAVSYGRTKQDCGQLRRWLDGFADDLEAGKMASPFGAQQAPREHQPNLSPTLTPIVLALLHQTVDKCGGPEKWSELLSGVRRVVRARDRRGIADFARTAVHTDTGAVQMVMLMLLGLSVGDALYGTIAADLAAREGNDG